MKKTVKKRIAALLAAALALAGFAAAETVTGSFEDGCYVIRMAVEDECWVADDMAQDPSVVTLGGAEYLDGSFIVRYEPAADGDVTVGVRHFDGIACDEVFTWDLAVRDGAVQEVTGGSHTASPDEEEQDAAVSGEWTVNDDIMAGMTVARNADRGWAVEIRTVGPEGAFVYRADMFFDCELDAFVYAGGTVYASEVTASGDSPLGEVVDDDASGTIRFVAAEDGEIRLRWYNDRAPEETADFHRFAG